MPLPKPMILTRSSSHVQLSVSIKSQVCKIRRLCRNRWSCPIRRSQKVQSLHLLQKKRKEKMQGDQNSPKRFNLFSIWSTTCRRVSSTECRAWRCNSSSPMVSRWESWNQDSSIAWVLTIPSYSSSPCCKINFFFFSKTPPIWPGWLPKWPKLSQ